MKEEYIIGVHGVPRSGTSWLGQLINASSLVNFKFQPLFSYAFKDYITFKSDCAEVNDFLNKIAASEDDFLNLRDSDLLGEYPHFDKKKSKTHLVFKHVRYHFLIEKFLECSKNIKFILIVRNPLEVLNSWRKAPREFNPLWDFENEWERASHKNQNRKEEYFGYHKWKEGTQLFHNLKLMYPEQIILINYNTLREYTLQEINKVYSFIELKVEHQVVNFIKDANRKALDHPNTVYKSSKRRIAYKNELPQYIQDFIHMDLKNTNLDYLLDDF